MSSAGASRRRLGFIAANRDRRQEWMLDPESKGVAQVSAEQSLSRVLAYRVWVDQRRGWRFTNPNLEELGLVRAEYLSLDDLAGDEAAFANSAPGAEGSPRRKHGGSSHRIAQSSAARTWQSPQMLSIPGLPRSTANAARQNLRDPWAISAPGRSRAVLPRCSSRRRTGPRQVFAVSR